VNEDEGAPTVAERFDLMVRDAGITGWRYLLLRADIEELEEHRAEVLAACLHYGGDPIKKWDGGKCPAFCPVCGVVIYRWA